MNISANVDWKCFPKTNKLKNIEEIKTDACTLLKKSTDFTSPN